MTDAVLENFSPIPVLAEELSLPPQSIAAVLALFEEGGTVPFIARYRKEATGSLDEVQIRDIQERHTYLMELEKRRQAILASIQEQEKLTPELQAQILATRSKAELEDLYLPYKPKRRTRAIIAREKGLEPLALRILEQPAAGNPEEEAAAFVSEEKEVASAEDALKGARDIVAEIIAENAEIRAQVRQTFLDKGTLVSEGIEEKTKERTKFEQYYDFSEAVATIPSHRFLALRRGEREGVLKVRIDVDGDALVGRILRFMEHDAASPFAEQLSLAAQDSYRRLLSSSVEVDVRVELKERSDRDAVQVFAENLSNLLLAAPLGEKPVLGIDPGLRTGCKCAMVDATGKFLETRTLYLHGAGRSEQAQKDLLEMVAQHGPALITVGNGTGGREAEAFVRKTLKMVPDPQIKGIPVIPVNESGASVYSASKVAREEFPELDLTIRGAISIARRVQDPLAELVKIDPKAIGVGQYQHDVHQPLLKRKLNEVVESCVNRVGVEMNTASAPLLAQVAGIGRSLAKKIVQHREAHGVFPSREALLKVSGLGPRTFEQAAGFLRVRGGAHPLDASAVHPERYTLVESMAEEIGVPIQELVGNEAAANRIDISRYISETIGEPTLKDIVAELKKPGRDPRDHFEPPEFREDIQELSDLKEGMQLQGVVTNVTHFGAFVDLGVHQDGLVHISELANEFVRDPSEHVKVGDRVQVRVLEVDLERKRISLSCRSEAPHGQSPSQNAMPSKKRERSQQGPSSASRRGRSDRPRRESGRKESSRRDSRQRSGSSSSRSSSSGGPLTSNPFAALQQLKGKG